MLGRQQIAGTQNAISELFKNAHDAYAKRVRIDFFEDEGTLIIRDDGVGMTREDFEEKWLVLGTESKAGENRKDQFRPPTMELRTVIGEKGIGRLAIALLGKQVLILTRAIREDGLHDLITGFLHWGLFEMPGLNLDEIEIPIGTLPGGTLPSPDHVEGLKASLKTCVERLIKDHPELDFRQVLAEIRGFQPDPGDLDRFFADRQGDALSLGGDATGTHFIIAPSNPVLAMELAVEERNQDYSFRKQLLGFADEVFGQATTPRITASFQRWTADALAGAELLDPETFFTREELDSRSDHLLRGTVDAFGQFSGNVRVYKQQYEGMIVPWPEAGGTRTECGPFEVIFGYLMGRETESLVVGDDFSDLGRKLDKIGGLYVYRDGIRILPYGDFSVDWLEVEKRRSKGAGYYFFSYRRMFGAVLLSREANENLQEKAGREGFQQNRAYRQLRDILVNLLIQLAAEFFRSGSGERAELFEKTQAEMRRRAESLARQQKRSSEQRKRLAKTLEVFFESIKAGAPEAAVKELRGLTRSRMELASRIEDQDKAATALIRAEREAIAGLNGLKDRYTCKRPAGVALTKELTREIDGYRIEKARLDSEVFAPFEEEIARTLGEVARQARIYVDQRKRLEERIRSLAGERQKQLQEVVNQTRESASDTRKTVFDITQKAMLALDSTVRQIEADLSRTDLNSLSPQKIEGLRKAWEDQLTEIEGRHRDALMAARDMLAALAENLRTSDGEEPAQIMEALEHRMLALEEEADENFEMVQLGLAVAIINHEFTAAIRKVRRSVQELGQVSRKSTTLWPLYQSIRANFEHLDGHLKLFTPLQRRLYRTTQEITGKSVRNYVTDLFKNRFDRHRVTLECTDAFLAATITCYPSTIYPAIINLVDNALFWLSNLKSERKIRFDVSAGDLIVTNTGPSIEERDRERIFERGFTRKPGGRGLGLFISRRALEAEKMHLHLDTPPAGFSVAFHIAAPTLRLS
ncbi:MAG: ATP-binding protein [candidate division NC10 bacterium]|nr:ATP-binding protein [candidate division NC10 bacterium]